MTSKTGVSSLPKKCPNFFFIYIKECLECLSYAVVKRKKKHLGVPLKEYYSAINNEFLISL